MMLGDIYIYIVIPESVVFDPHSEWCAIPFPSCFSTFSIGASFMLLIWALGQPKQLSSARQRRLTWRRYPAWLWRVTSSLSHSRAVGQIATQLTDATAPFAQWTFWSLVEEDTRKRQQDVGYLCTYQRDWPYCSDLVPVESCLAVSAVVDYWWCWRITNFAAVDDNDCWLLIVDGWWAYATGLMPPKSHFVPSSTYTHTKRPPTQKWHDDRWIQTFNHQCWIHSCYQPPVGAGSQPTNQNQPNPKWSLPLTALIRNDKQFLSIPPYLLEYLKNMCKHG